MDCTQIRNRLSDPIAFHAPDVQAHIRVCADCRAVYEAESVLRDSLSAERRRVPASDYGTAAQWIDRVTVKERKKMPSFMTSPLATPARRWGVGLVAAALAFFVLIPLPYDRTVGTMLSITSDDPAMARISTASLSERLAERGLQGVKVVDEVAGSAHTLTYYVPGSQSDAQAAFEATRDLVPSAAAKGEIRFAAWTVRESGTLLAQITGGSYDFNVATAGKSDAEIAQEIRSQLESQGMQIQNLSVSRDDTSATMNMTFTPDGATGESQAVIRQVIHGDEAAAPAIEGKVFMPQVDKSLPVEEQVEQIKAQLAANGITNVDVKVVDGKIVVEAKQEDVIRR